MKIAILGLGTIGYGVYDIIQKQFFDVTVTKVLDKDKSKQQLISAVVTTDINDIINDPDIELVVEALGGIDDPYHYIKECLIHKKHVVTANKEVIAVYLNELTKLKQEHNVSLSFEASVGGGVPIIKNIIDIANTNKIISIEGIINGTTNYILTRLSEGMSFDEALQLAREKGFAEANATYDLDGLDMVRKIAILSMIATNHVIDITKIYHYSMKNCQASDLEFATKNNYNIKYMASFVNDYISVEPVMISKNSLFNSVNDEYNLIEVKATNYDNLAFYGKGAGRYPTANAIINDIIDIKNNNKNYTFASIGDFVFQNDTSAYNFYLHIKEDYNLKENLILQRENNHIITKPMLRKDIDFDQVIFYARIK